MQKLCNNGFTDSNEIKQKIRPYLNSNEYGKLQNSKIYQMLKLAPQMGW